MNEEGPKNNQERDISPEEARRNLEMYEEQAREALAGNGEVYRILVEELKEDEAKKGAAAHFRDITPDHLTDCDLYMFFRVKQGDFDGPSGMQEFQKLHFMIQKFINIAEIDESVSMSRRSFYAYLGNVMGSREKKS